MIQNDEELERDSAGYQSAALNDVSTLLEQSDVVAADEALESLSPATRLIVLSRLSPELRRLLIEEIGAEDAADYLHDIPEVQAARPAGTN